MKRKPTRRPARAADSLARMQGQIAALISEGSAVRSRLDELESWRKSTERRDADPPMQIDGDGRISRIPTEGIEQEVADIRARLDKLEVVREPAATTEEQS